MDVALANELFVKKNPDSSYVVYSPISHTILKVNQSFVHLLQKARNEGLENLVKDELEILTEANLVTPNSCESGSRIKKYQEFIPTNLTLFPTNNCNLRCLYCYGNAGEFEVRNLDTHIAYAAIDLVIGNAHRLGKEESAIVYHGGGEPATQWDFILDTVSYAKQKASELGLKTRFGIATNGVLPVSKVEWLAENFKNITLSFDGPQDIQDYNRPLANGEGSFRFVDKTARRLAAIGAQFSIRSTITEYSVGRQKELVDFFYDTYGSKSIHMEPLFECGRCMTSKMHAPDPELFAENFIEAFIYGSGKDIVVRNSLFNINTIKDQFCGAYGRNFCVTPEGYISSCYEVSLLEDPRSDKFFYGVYDPENNGFLIFEEKRQALLQKDVNSVGRCQDCYVKLNCGGDCLAKSVLSDENSQLTDNLDSRCLIRQSVAEKYFNLLLDNSGICNIMNPTILGQS